MWHEAYQLWDQKQANIEDQRTETNIIEDQRPEVNL